MSGRSDPPPMTDEELDALDAWGEGVLAQADKTVAAAQLCAYRTDLPSSVPSIRSTIVTLVAEVRRLRALVAARTALESEQKSAGAQP